MRFRFARLALVAFAAAGAMLGAACGARTALENEVAPHHARDAGVDVQVEAAGDATIDRDSGVDAIVDALPPIDALRPPDGAPCSEGGLTAYLISQDGQLYAFDPPTLSTQLLGPLRCPTSAPAWTLTASSAGIVYVIYEDWRIYEVDPRTLVCTRTPYLPGQLSLGIDDSITVSPDDDGGESLYVYGQAGGRTVLATSNLTSFVLSEVGPVLPAPSKFPLDVRADAFGRIFGLSAGGVFDEIDRKTAALVAEDKTTFTSGGSWALLTYDKSVYFFSGGVISTYDLSTKRVAPYGSIDVQVVGASAAPCLR